MNLLIKLILVISSIKNFHQAILDRLGLIHGEVVYNLRNNTKFYARCGTEDLAEIAVVASGSEYNMKNILLPKNPIIIDLGGHIGTFSIPTAKTFKDKCKIYSFEPDNKNYELLKKNLTLNKINSVVVSNVALSDYIGEGYLKTENMSTDAYYLSKSKNRKNCLVSTLYNESKKYKIKEIDLLKMDIEGEEYNIFKHKESLDFILKNVHYIFIEVGPAYKSSRIKKIIDKNFLTINRNKNVLTLENLNWKN